MRVLCFAIAPLLTVGKGGQLEVVAGSCEEAERKRRVLERVVFVMRSHSMVRAFKDWRDKVATAVWEREASRELMERIVRRMMHSTLTAAFDAWRDAPEPQGSPPVSPVEREDKFVAPKLILGPSNVAARGIQNYIGITDLSFTASESLGLQTIMAEWMKHGTPEDIQNMLYVVKMKALEPIPLHIQRCIQKGYYHGGRLRAQDFDTGNKGKMLRDFVDHPFSKMAGNSAPEVTPPSPPAVLALQRALLRFCRRPLACWTGVAARREAGRGSSLEPD